MRSRFLTLSLAGGFMATAAWVGWLTPAIAAEPIQAVLATGPFEADPAQLGAAFGSLETPPGAPGHVLLREFRYVLDAKGNDTITRREIAIILSPSALKLFSVINVGWAPWRQERPVIRARVIAPGGRVHWLDESTIAEAPAPTQIPNVFQDLRLLQAPLPAMEAGSIVEQEVVYRKSKPLFDAGTFSTVPLGGFSPVRFAKVVIDRPERLHLRHTTHGLPSARVGEERSDGRIRTTFEAERLEGLRWLHLFTPGDVRQVPSVLFSTGRSWREVAARYAGIVDQIIARDEAAPEVTSFLPGLRTGDGGKASAGQLLASLRKKVRYTGVEFGSASIIPRAPSEVFSRRYGDCKDQAVALVAMLRAAGHEAHVALLKTGPGEDVHPDLPGFGAFDHAIVVVPGEDPLWIDPSSGFAPAGSLPEQDQGRLALIIDEGTGGLVLTPVSTMAENFQAETREILLQELGPAKLIETTTFGGSVAQQFRQQYEGTDRERLRLEFERYVREGFSSEGLTRFEMSEPDDLNSPFRLRLEAEGVKIAQTDQMQAVVALPARFDVGTLGAVLLSERLAPDMSPAAELLQGQGAEIPRRDYDLELPAPYRTEVTYQIVPPPGFNLELLPPEEGFTSGPVRLVRGYEKTEGGPVVARFSFEVAARRLDPEVVEEVRRELLGAEMDSPVVMTFESRGMGFLAEGKMLEALDEFRRLASVHPDETLHEAQIIDTLLAAGLGETARRRAAAMAREHPEDSLAHSTFGWVLQHDAAAVRFGSGADLSAAESELRRSIELDPEDPSLRLQIASVLEHDEVGRRFHPGSRLDQAIDQYRHVRGKLGNSAADDALLLALFSAGRHEDVVRLARELEQTPERQVLLLASTTALKSAGPAVLEARRLHTRSQDRAEALMAAVFLLACNRWFGPAAELASAASREAGNDREMSYTASLYRRVSENQSPVEPGGLEVAGRAARRIVPLLLQRPAASEEIAGLVAQDLASPEKLHAALEGIRARSAGLLAAYEQGAFPEAIALEVIFASAGVMIDGDTKLGYRVVFKIEGDPRPPGASVFLREIDGSLRVVAASGDLSRLGAEAMRRLDGGDIEGARKWIQWGADEAHGSAVAQWGHGLPVLAIMEMQDLFDERRLEYAAASLMAEGDRAAEALPILRRGREVAEAEDLRYMLDLAIALAHLSMRNLESLLPLAKRLSSVDPPLGPAEALLLLAHSGLGHWKECLEISRVPSAKEPIRSIRLLFRARCASSLDRDEEASGALADLERTGAPPPWLYNSLAWDALFDEKPDSRSLRWAEAAVSGPLPGSGALHTLATVHARDGRLHEARDALHRSIAARGAEGPTSDDWLVIGLIAERLGLTEEARSAFTRVEAPAATTPGHRTAHDLARLQLARLDGHD